MNDREQAAIDGVRQFAAALAEIRGRLFVDFPELDDLPSLLRAVVTKAVPRQARSSSGIEYSVHGMGCWMADERGREVDIDSVGGAEVFDGWRIRRFLYEDYDREGGDLSADELFVACAQLAARGASRDRAGPPLRSPTVS